MADSVASLRTQLSRMQFMLRGVDDPLAIRMLGEIITEIERELRSAEAAADLIASQAPG